MKIKNNENKILLIVMCIFDLFVLSGFISIHNNLILSFFTSKFSFIVFLIAIAFYSVAFIGVRFFIENFIRNFCKIFNLKYKK